VGVLSSVYQVLYQVGVLTWRGDGSIIGMAPGEYYTSKFCNLVVNSGMHVAPLEVSVLGSKKSSLKGKVK